MPRCPDCNKFASIEEEEPEVESIDINDGQISASVRITNNCAECGTEMTEAQLEIEDQLESSLLEKHHGNKHEMSIEEDGVERDQRTEGKGRGLRTFYGARITYKVTCSCSKNDTPIHEGELYDDVQASSMDECC